jgi:hypothetical protein
MHARALYVPGMEELGEVAVRTLGAVLRAAAQIVFECLFEYVAAPIWRAIAAPYRCIRTLIGRWVPWDILATPLALLLFAFCIAAAFYGIVTLLQLGLP